MKTYYVTLVHALSGYYMVFEAPSENAVRTYCHDNLGHLWCSVYINTERMTEKRLGHITYLDERGRRS